MADRPLILPGWAVRAVLREIEAPGTGKSQHRVVLRDQPGELDRPFKMDDGTWHVTDSRGGHMSPLSVKYRDGDSLWVREAHRFIDGTGSHNWDGAYQYRADGAVKYGRWFSEAEWGEIAPSNVWCPSIHMPRWASRLTLLVSNVRVQRVQDITEEDARAEGCACEGDWPLSEFRDLWADQHGPDAWARNDWIVALTFRPIPRNIDMEA